MEIIDSLAFHAELFFVTYFMCPFRLFAAYFLAVGFLIFLLVACLLILAWTFTDLFPFFVFLSVQSCVTLVILLAV